jgi:hypothetical protein
VRGFVRKTPGKNYRRVQYEPAHGLLSSSNSLTLIPPRERW